MLCNLRPQAAAAGSGDNSVFLRSVGERVHKSKVPLSLAVFLVGQQGGSKLSNPGLNRRAHQGGQDDKSNPGPGEANLDAIPMPPHPPRVLSAGQLYLNLPLERQ